MLMVCTYTRGSSLTPFIVIVASRRRSTPRGHGCVFVCYCVLFREHSSGNISSYLGPYFTTRPCFNGKYRPYDDVTIGQYHIQTTYTCTCTEVHSYVYMRNYSISYTIFVTVRNKRNNMCGEKNCTTATVGGNLLVRTELVVDQCVRRTFHDGGNRRVV